MKSNFKEEHYGFAFRNGKLYWFDKLHVLVMTSWSDPRPWLKRRSHDWKASRKWVDQLLTLACHTLERGESLEPAPSGPEVLASGQYLHPGVYSSSQQRFEALEKRNRRVMTLLDRIVTNV